MNISLPLGAARAAPALSRATARAQAILSAARRILASLERGRRVDGAVLREAMEQSFGGSDADGAWDWKTAYEASEAATVLFLRKIAPALRSRAPSPRAELPIFMKIAALLPSHTRRSVESEALQQFSTPIELGFAASVAASADLSRSRPGAIGGYRASRHPRRARWRIALTQRIRRDPGRPPRSSLSGRPRQPFRRCADRRSPGGCDRPDGRADEPALLSARPCRSRHARRRASPYRLRAREALSRRAACRHHRDQLCA